MFATLKVTAIVQYLQLSEKSLAASHCWQVAALVAAYAVRHGLLFNVIFIIYLEWLAQKQ